MLTKKECSVLRGLAIIGIFLHNFCHWLNPIVKENEYQYFQHNVDWFCQVLVHPDGNLPVHILSFFGHYGVPVFLFLSAYGLVMKYEKIDHAATHRPAPIPFIRYHFVKLFKMMIVGFVAFTMLDQITAGAHGYHAVDVIAQLLLINNILPNPDNIIWPGPYWFFGLMLQLYIVYRLLLYKRGWKWTIGLMIICWLLQIFCDPEGETLNRLRYNFMGGMLPFGLGLLYAHYGRKLTDQQYGIITVVSFCLIIGFSFNYQLWFWVPAFVCSFSVGFAKCLSALAGRSSLFSSLFSGLDWMGGISAALFVCHPITRKIFIPISRGGDIYAGLLLYIVASICLAWVFKKFMDRLPKTTMR